MGTNNVEFWRTQGTDALAHGSVTVCSALLCLLAAVGEVAGVGGAIFCQRLDAELLRIGTVFLVADDMPRAMQGRAVRAWCEGDAMHLTAL